MKLVDAINQNMNLDEITKLIKKHGREFINELCPHGYESPLHLAANKGDTALVGLLLNEGARVDITNKDGDTPLHSAARAQRVNAAKLLVESGANLTAKNKDGQQPADVISEVNPFPEFVHALRSNSGWDDAVSKQLQREKRLLAWNLHSQNKARIFNEEAWNSYNDFDGRYHPLAPGGNCSSPRDSWEEDPDEVIIPDNNSSPRS